MKGGKMAELGEGGFTPEEAAQEIAGGEPEREERKYETKSTPDIIGEPDIHKIEQIPPGEFWVVDTISHAEISIPSNSGIRAEVAVDVVFKIEDGASVDIPEEGNEFEVRIMKRAA